MEIISRLDGKRVLSREYLPQSLEHAAFVVGRSGARSLKGSTNRALLAKETADERSPFLRHATCGREQGVHQSRGWLYSNGQ
jgi:hypothetical protein